MKIVHLLIFDYLAIVLKNCQKEVVKTRQFVLSLLGCLWIIRRQESTAIISELNTLFRTLFRRTSNLSIMPKSLESAEGVYTRCQRLCKVCRLSGLALGHRSSLPSTSSNCTDGADRS